MSKFKVGQKAIWKYFGHEYPVIILSVYDNSCLIWDMDNLHHQQVDNNKLTPIPEITVYAVCDAKGNYINGTACIDIQQTEALRDQHHSGLTIRPYVLTPINE